MSRGFGVWQRRVLEELGRRECFYLTDIVPCDPDYPRKHLDVNKYFAAYRAARSLAKSGRVSITKFERGMNAKIAICAPGGSVVRVWNHKNNCLPDCCCIECYPIFTVESL